MDPLTITLQVASGVTSTVNAFQSYTDYRGKYNSADLSTLSLKMQCECISVALSQIHETLCKHPRVANQLTKEDDGSVKTFNSVLGACQLTFRIIEKRIKKHTQNETNKYSIMSHRAKVKLVWNDREIKELALSLSGIARGLDLLLAAISLKSNFEIREALTNQRASVIVEKVVGDVRSLRSSYHLESSDSLDLQLRDPYPLLHEISRDNNRSECVHRQNKSAQRGLQHVISKPPDLGVRENTDLTLGSNLSPKSVPETTPTCIVKHSDADISALVNDSSRWLEGITFDLRDQCLTSFEPHWVQLIGQGTQRLALERNLLTSLPSTFDQFTRLVYLSLRGNQLVEIPNLRCPKLEVLELSYNKLTSLPARLADRFSGLKVLRLEHNKIEHLPFDMCNMKALLKLRIHGNPLVDPPRDIIESLWIDPSGAHDDTWGTRYRVWSAQYNDPEIKFTKIILKHLKLRLARITDCPEEEKEKMRYELFELCPLPFLKMVGND